VVTLKITVFWDVFKFSLPMYPLFYPEVGTSSVLQYDANDYQIIQSHVPKD
jgi:hypothetical protein